MDRSFRRPAAVRSYRATLASSSAAGSADNARAIRRGVGAGAESAYAAAFDAWRAGMTRKPPSWWWDTAQERLCPRHNTDADGEHDRQHVEGHHGRLPGTSF